MNLATMKSVATALEKQIRVDASAEETGGAEEKVLAPGEMPEPLSQTDWDKLSSSKPSSSVEPSTTIEPKSKDSENVPKSSAPVGLSTAKLRSVRDEVIKTNGADIKDIVQKIGPDNIKFILKNAIGPNAKIVTTLERDGKPIVLGINLQDDTGQANTQNQAYLNVVSTEESLKSSANDPKNGLKLFMPNEFEELFSKITPVASKDKTTSSATPETDAIPATEKPVAAPAVTTPSKEPTLTAPSEAPAVSEDRWKPLASKLTEKGIPEDVAKKVLEFFGSKTKKIKLVEDDILSEARPPGSADEEVKFTEWLKAQNFGDEINKKIIEALVEVSGETKLISKTNLGKTLTKNMGYTKPRELSGQPKSAKETTPVTDAGEEAATQDQKDGEDEESDQWSEVKKNPQGWELTTVKGTTVKIADAITLPSGKKTYTVVKPDGATSGPINPDLIAVVAKAKADTKPPEVPIAKPETSTKVPTPPAPAAKPEATPSVTPAPAATSAQKTALSSDEQSNEQKALSYIKQKIKNAAALSTKQIRVRDLYNKANFVDSGNVTDLLNKIKTDPEIKDLIGALDSKTTGKIILKVGTKAKSSQSEKPDEGELDISKLKLGGESGEDLAVSPEGDEESLPQDETDTEEEPEDIKKTGKKVSKSTKTTPSTEDLEAIKKKAISIFKKYAKEEGKEGEDLKVFINNIENAKNKSSIVQIFDNVLDETNAFKASEELNGGSSKKAEAPPIGPDIDATEAQLEPEMTPEKLQYGKKQVEKILGTNSVKISSDIKKALEAAEDESGLRGVLLDSLEDATEAKMELTKALEDYDSKQVQKESVTRPMFVLKEGIFRLNR